jgi:radical SAM protein with 4Fe4S-binding SPASM domain
MKNLKVSKYLHFQPVDNETSIGWNRFFPSIFILNDAALDLLDHIKNNKTIEDMDNEEIEHYLKAFKKYNFLYEGDSGDDPFKENFLKMVKQKLEEPERVAKEFYSQEKDYDDLKIVNDDCNLACAYCVNNYGENHTGIKKRDAALKFVNTCVDQFFARKIKNRSQEAKIFFNGGEILVHWDLIKQVVERISKKYKDIKLEYGINTNLTLLTEKIAEFFNRHNFKVHISIDGYREAHNRTRIYHNGKGSFDDIIEKLEIYRKYNKEKGMKSFQGTIEYPDRFKPGDVYKMDKYGFASARLAPNLLNCSEEDAKNKARLMGKFLKLNSLHEFQVTELIFNKLKNKINQEEYAFSFNCRGLSPRGKLGIEINLSTLSLSHLCGFIPAAALPFEELEYDIYNPKLWEVSFKFIRERMESLFKNCMECQLVGICAGGCILSGLDRENRLNKAACAYQKEMWKIYVKKAYEDSKK